MFYTICELELGYYRVFIPLTKTLALISLITCLQPRPRFESTCNNSQSLPETL